MDATVADLASIVQFHWQLLGLTKRWRWHRGGCARERQTLYGGQQTDSRHESDWHDSHSSIVHGSAAFSSNVRYTYCGNAPDQRLLHCCDAYAVCAVKAQRHSRVDGVLSVLWDSHTCGCIVAYI